jgi:hypothetical protein
MKSVRHEDAEAPRGDTLLALAETGIVPAR